MQYLAPCLAPCLVFAYIGSVRSVAPKPSICWCLAFRQVICFAISISISLSGKLVSTFWMVFTKWRNGEVFFLKKCLPASVYWSLGLLTKLRKSQNTHYSPSERVPKPLTKLLSESDCTKPVFGFPLGVVYGFEIRTHGGCAEFAWSLGGFHDPAGRYTIINPGGLGRIQTTW